MILKRIGWLTLGNSINVILSFASLPYLVRVLSKADYGTYGQTILLVDFATVLFSLGLSQIIPVYLAKREERPNEVTVMSIALGFLSGLLGLLALFVCKDFLASQMNNVSLQKTIFYYSLSLPFQVVQSVIYVTLVYCDRAGRAASILVLSNSLRLISITIGIYVLNGVEDIFLLLTLSSILSAAMAFQMLPEKYRIDCKIDVELCRSLLKQGIPLSFSGIFGLFFKVLDGFMVSLFFAPSIYAMFRAGAFEIPLLSTLYLSVATAVMPEFAKLYEKKKYSEISILNRRIFRLTAAITYPMITFVIINNTELIETLLGKKYGDSGKIFAVYTAILFLRAMDYHGLLVVGGQSGRILKMYIYASILNLGLNVLAIKTLGIYGVAYATLVSFFFFAGYSMFYSAKVLEKKVIDIVPIGFLIKLILITFGLSAIVYQINSLYLSGFLLSVVNFVVVMPVSVLILFKFGFVDVEERQVLKRKFPKIIGKLEEKLKIA